MKITQKDTEFSPVTIVLETPAEVATVLAAVGKSSKSANDAWLLSKGLVETEYGDSFILYNNLYNIMEGLKTMN